MIKFILKIHHKINKKIIIPLLAKYRRKKLKYTDFTIISNNCFAGVCYEYFNMKKLSPTVGAYFFAEDYVRFCKNLRFYCELSLEIISPMMSKHKDSILEQHNGTVIIGRLGDIEMVFLHYKDAETVLNKWSKRVKRINWDRIILKFSYQNNCNDELVKEFLEIADYPKFVLVGEKITDNKDEIQFRMARGKETLLETNNFGLFFDPVKLINSRL